MGLPDPEPKLLRQAEKRPAKLTRPDEIDLWIVPHGEISADQDVLSVEEVARAARFASTKRRAGFVSVRSALRRLLGASLGCDPADLKFARSSKGKPALSMPAAVPLAFNVSHALGRSLIAIGQDIDLGVDVEEIGQSVDFPEMAKRFFPRDEATAITAMPPAEAAIAFLTAWTRKEALAKALGESVADTLATGVTVAPLRDGAAIDRGEHGGARRRWFLYTPDVGPNHVAALVLSRPVRSVVVRQLQ